MARPCIYSPSCSFLKLFFGKPGDGAQNFSQLDWVTASLFLMMTKIYKCIISKLPELDNYLRAVCAVIEKLRSMPWRKIDFTMW